MDIVERSKKAVDRAAKELEHEKDRLRIAKKLAKTSIAKFLDEHGFALSCYTYPNGVTNKTVAGSMYNSHKLLYLLRNYEILPWTILSSGIIVHPGKDAPEDALMMSLMDGSKNFYLEIGLCKYTSSISLIVQVPNFGTLIVEMSVNNDDVYALTDIIPTEDNELGITTIDVNTGRYPEYFVYDLINRKDYHNIMVYTHIENFLESEFMSINSDGFSKKINM